MVTQYDGELVKHDGQLVEEALSDGEAAGDWAEQGQVHTGGTIFIIKMEVG